MKPEAASQLLTCIEAGSRMAVLDLLGPPRQTALAVMSAMASVRAAAYVGASAAVGCTARLRSG